MVEIVITSTEFGDGAGADVFRQGSESGQCTHGVYTEGTHVGVGGADSKIGSRQGDFGFG